MPASASLACRSLVMDEGGRGAREHGRMTDAGAIYGVRRALAADLPAVLEVLAQNEAIAPEHPPLPSALASGRQQRTWARVIGTDGLTIYLAVHVPGDSEHAVGHERPVGTAAMLLMPHLTYDCRPSAFIEAVVVAYAHRRRGVGRLLVQRALDDARAASCQKVQLLSHKRHTDDGAHQLYRALGFTAEAEGFRLYLEP